VKYCRYILGVGEGRR